MLLEVALRVSPVAHHPRDQAVSLVDRVPWVVDEATLHRSPLPGILVAGIRAQLADLQLPAAFHTLLEAARGLVAVTRRLHRALVLGAEPGAELAAAPVPQSGPQREPESDEHQDHKDRDDDGHRGHVSPPTLFRNMSLILYDNLSVGLRFGNWSASWLLAATGIGPRQPERLGQVPNEDPHHRQYPHPIDTKEVALEPRCGLSTSASIPGDRGSG